MRCDASCTAVGVAACGTPHNEDLIWGRLNCGPAFHSQIHTRPQSLMDRLRSMTRRRVSPVDCLCPPVGTDRDGQTRHTDTNTLTQTKRERERERELPPTAQSIASSVPGRRVARDAPRAFSATTLASSCAAEQAPTAHADRGSADTPPLPCTPARPEAKAHAAGIRAPEFCHWLVRRAHDSVAWCPARLPAARPTRGRRVHASLPGRHFPRRNSARQGRARDRPQIRDRKCSRRRLRTRTWRPW